MTMTHHRTTHHRTTHHRTTGRVHLGRTARLLAAALATGAVVVTLTAAPAQAADDPPEVSRRVTIPSFYDPPGTLPSRDGTLVRSEPLRLGAGLTLPGVGSLPGTATRLMYTTTDSTGHTAAVTGAYIEPAARWSGGGTRPLAVVAPGTMGQGDQCAPSLALEHPLTFNGETVSVGYEDVAVYRLLAQGVAVVVTDYVGLGTTDRLHTYVNRVDEAHAVLDAARAARQVPGASVTPSSRVGLYGYSQGGGATAAAAELRTTYALDVNLVGSYVGAPPADLVATAKGIDGSALAGALGWTLNGLVQAYPALGPVVDGHLDAKGRAALADLATACTGDAVFGHGFERTSSWTSDGESLSQIIAKEPAVQAVVAAQKIGDRTPYGAVRVATGTQDDIVPHAQARQLAVSWCQRGGDVTYVPVILPNLGDKLLTNHLAPLLADQGDAVAWLTKRLSGSSTSSNCWSMPIQP
jgi:dienelactone hydrolase